jgi:phage RecT family recombinase
VSDTEVPKELLALVSERKDAVYAERLVQHYRPDFEKALAYELMSGHLAFEPFVAAVKQDVANSPKLGEAARSSPGSLIAALLFAAQCKLLPGGVHGQFYLIPRKMNRKRGSGWSKVMEVTSLIGYKGLCTMMQRHHRVHSVEAHCVYDGEEFDYEPGSGKLHHRWNPRIERTDDAIIACYAKVIITEPTTSHVVPTPIVWPLTRKDIERARSRSEAWKHAESGDPQYGGGKKDSPWHTDFPAMARKSALRAIGSNGSVPRDMGLGGALSQDSESEVDKGDAEILPIPKATQGAQIRATLGIDKPVVEFIMPEDAVEAIKRAGSVAELERLASGWQHHTGSDAEMIALAYEDRLRELGE